MSIVKRGNIYWAIFTAPNGQRIRKSTGTTNKRLAQEFHDNLKADMWRIVKLGEKPKKLWQDAAKRWVREKGHKKSIEDDKRFLRWFGDYLYNKPLIHINKELINALVERKQNEGVSNGTVNRYFTLLRAVLNRAKNEWEWIDIVPKIARLDEPPARDRTLSNSDLRRLLAVLPKHTHSMCIFALATGLRAANVAQMRWDQINLENRTAYVSASNAKAGKPIGIPLNDDAMAILEREKGQHETFVFTYLGKPMKNASREAWNTALKRAGIENFRWHDLRHMWATRHAVEGTPIQALKRLGAWASWKSMDRYIHMATADVAKYAVNVEIEDKAGTS